MIKDSFNAVNNQCSASFRVEKIVHAGIAKAIVRHHRKSFAHESTVRGRDPAPGQPLGESGVAIKEYWGSRLNILGGLELPQDAAGPGSHPQTSLPSPNWFSY